jgi:epoxyqueuosine reductase
MVFLAESVPGASIKTFVDSNGLLERAFARRAGLGFIGKNNLLVNPRYGSYISLGLLLTNVELPPDTSTIKADPCASCQRCQNACPGGAIDVARDLDARRCLTFLNYVRANVVLTPEQMECMGGWLFGCDACQEACPFNQKAETRDEGDISLFEANDDSPYRRATFSLGDVLRMRSDEEFDTKFAGTGIARMRMKGLQRNAVIVAANLKRKDLEPDIRRLTEAETDPISALGVAARWALDRLSELE